MQSLCFVEIFNSTVLNFDIKSEFLRVFYYMYDIRRTEKVIQPLVIFIARRIEKVHFMPEKRWVLTGLFIITISAGFGFQSVDVLYMLNPFVSWYIFTECYLGFTDLYFK